MRRSFAFKTLSGETISEVEIGKVSSIDTDSRMFVIEEMKDGKWRLLYSKSLVPDLTAIDRIEIIREG